MSVRILSRVDDTVFDSFFIIPGDLKCFNYISSNLDLSNKIQTIQLQKGKTFIEWEEVKGIPSDFRWFENVWKNFSDGTVFK